MKRTWEFVLGIIGILVYVLSAGFGGVMIWMHLNKANFEDSIEQSAQGSTSSDTESINSMIDSLGSVGWTLTLSASAAIILGIIALLYLRKDKNPKVAGIIFLVTAIITSVVTLGAAVVGGIFFIIVSIMCLTRKPLQLIEG